MFLKAIIYIKPIEVMKDSLKVKRLSMRDSFLSTKAKTLDLDKDLVSIQTNKIAEIHTENDLKLDVWFANNKEVVNQLLAKHGAILFRGFKSDVTNFIQFKNVAFSAPMDYKDASSPRTEIEKQVYTSTDYPQEETIQMHCELSYSHIWPEKLAFFCENPPTTGGSTILADTRKVLELIPEGIKNKFRLLGVNYYRFLTEEAGLPWYKVFGTNDKNQVEQYCEKHQITYSWEANNAFKMEWHRPAIKQHMITKEDVWFNHSLFFNKLALPSVLKNKIPDNDLPFNTYFGDGTAIKQEEFNQIKQAYNSTQFNVLWEKGDFVLVDNLLMSHGRESYTGPRKILVAMGDPASDN